MSTLPLRSASIQISRTAITITASTKWITIGSFKSSSWLNPRESPSGNRAFETEPFYTTCPQTVQSSFSPTGPSSAVKFAHQKTTFWGKKRIASSSLKPSNSSQVLSHALFQIAFILLQAESLYRPLHPSLRLHFAIQKDLLPESSVQRS